MTEGLEPDGTDILVFGFGGMFFFASGLAALNGWPDLLILPSYSMEMSVQLLSAAFGAPGAVPDGVGYGITVVLGFLLMLVSVLMALEVIASDE